MPQNFTIEQIRTTTFSLIRRGYDRREVDRFLAELADWLEVGGGDDARHETVKRELERVADKTSSILTAAEESAEQTRRDAEREADFERREADEYSTRLRRDADEYADTTRGQANADAQRTTSEAEAKSARIIGEGERRRGDIEAVIADLAERRDQVIAEIESLREVLGRAASDHRPAPGADRFAPPIELDPIDEVADPMP